MGTFFAIFFAIVVAWFVITGIRSYCHGLAIKHMLDLEAEAEARERVKAANERVAAQQAPTADVVELTTEDTHLTRLKAICDAVPQQYTAFFVDVISATLDGKDFEVPDYFDSADCLGDSLTDFGDKFDAEVSGLTESEARLAMKQCAYYLNQRA
ncbi:hypothetical protein ACF1UB_002713 [Vibrio fluvialis]